MKMPKTAIDNLSSDIFELVKKYESKISAADFSLILLKWATWTTIRYAPSRQEGFKFINDCIQESIKRFNELEEEYGQED